MTSTPHLHATLRNTLELATDPLLFVPLQEYCPLSWRANERITRDPLGYTILSEVLLTLTLSCDQNTTGGGTPTMMQSRRSGCLRGEIVFTGWTSIRGSSSFAIRENILRHNYISQTRDIWGIGSCLLST
jgi:hypothetical protein